MQQIEDEHILDNDPSTIEIPLISDLSFYRNISPSYRFLKTQTGKLVVIPLINIHLKISALFFALFALLCIIFYSFQIFPFSLSLFLLMLLGYLYFRTLEPYCITLDEHGFHLYFRKVLGGTRLDTIDVTRIESITTCVSKQFFDLSTIYWGKVGIVTRNREETIFFKLGTRKKEKARYCAQLVAEEFAHSLKVPITNVSPIR